MSNNDEQPSTEATPAPDLDDTAIGNNDADVNKFDHITPTMARELVSRYHVTTTDLGCWESDVKRRRKGYCQLKLKELRYVNIFLHQLALIADDRGAELKTILGTRSYHISHLCHNDTCSNPDHLVVESAQQNYRRKTCVGHKVIRYRDFEYHPCRHGEVEKMRQCIIPLLRLGPGDHVNGSE
ncbi:zinc-binding loop region of homing endonuclease-domain-containing protein [Lipomyces starkeyi]